MNSIAANQARVFWQLFTELSASFRTDRNLPGRIQKRLASERRFGSRDRRLYRELLYTSLRYLPWVEQLQARPEAEAWEAIVWLAAPIPALRALKEQLPAQFAGAEQSVGAKAKILGVSASLLPEWFVHECPGATGTPEIDVLHTRSPLWLRLQTDAPQAVLGEFESRGWSWRQLPAFPDAVELLGDVDVTQTEAFLAGKIEVQDLGSQLVLQAVAPSPGSHWLDACAGAGGKTLQLARALGPQGSVAAHDIRPAALEELQQRARRASLRNVTIQTNPSGQFDGVLVDAPCSGSGTWRRSPHLKWCTSASDVTNAAELQKTLLARFATFVKPGGTLVYATCSLCRSEDAAVVESFLAGHADFSVDDLAHSAAAARFGLDRQSTGLTVWPSTHNTDGFFVSVLRRAG
ncbi:RNA methyltransferase [Opitutaceae bacterium EW11]|nr:RNA methyltransferase [Opitutaceae bacterium EW11]